MGGRAVGGRGDCHVTEVNRDETASGSCDREGTGQVPKQGSLYSFLLSC